MPSTGRRAFVDTLRELIRTADGCRPLSALGSRNHDGKPQRFGSFDACSWATPASRPQIRARPPGRRAPPSRRCRGRHLRRPHKRREGAPTAARHRAAPPARRRHVEDHAPGPPRPIGPTPRHARRRAPREGRRTTRHRARHRHDHRRRSRDVQNAVVLQSYSASSSSPTPATGSPPPASAAAKEGGARSSTRSRSHSRSSSTTPASAPSSRSRTSSRFPGRRSTVTSTRPPRAGAPHSPTAA